MAKRKKKEVMDGDLVDHDVHQDAIDKTDTELKLRTAVFGEREQLHQVRLVCAQLKRIAKPSPDHIYKFVERILAIADSTES